MAAEFAMDEKLLEELRRIAGERSAIRVLLASIIASHPNPKKLLEEVSRFTSLEMTVLATSSQNEQFRDELRNHFSNYLDAMIHQLPAFD
jgi:hypothetical protein